VENFKDGDAESGMVGKSKKSRRTSHGYYNFSVASSIFNLNKPAYGASRKWALDCP
jgi:hypothetical protein